MTGDTGFPMMDEQPRSAPNTLDSLMAPAGHPRPDDGPCQPGTCAPPAGPDSDAPC